MNDLLQQLVGMGPGIGAAVSGNGNAFASFMDGWQRAQMRDQQQKRLTQQDAIAAQDRDRMIGRQEVQDARAAEDQEFQRNARNMSVAGTLGQAASGAESIPEGEAAIDTLFRVLSPQAQQTMAPARDAALSGVQRTVTGRQKKQVEAFVEAAVKTAHVADNPDADPELINLPEHIQRIVGKPSARLSELQQFAQLPVGKPQGKTRVPPAGGSFEDYVEKAYGPNPTADQILQARKAYQQSDDRAPRITVQTDGIDRASALKFQDDYARDSKPYLTMREAYQRVKAAKPDAAGDLSLIFAYMKILDPNSVVREQEFANAQNAAGVPARVRNLYNQVMEGVRLNPEQRSQFQSQAEALFEGAKTNQRGVRKTYGDRARQWKIPENMVLDAEDEFLTAPPPAPATAPAATGGPQPGERRKAPDGSLVEWDGKGWKPVRF
jgi:hypothetical protein